MNFTAAQQLATRSHDPWLARTMRIVRVTPETPGVATYDLEFEDRTVADKYSFRPGQFNMLYLPGLGEIAISISGDPNRHEFVPHTIREAGNVTRSLAKLSEGASIGLRGPFGSCWPIEECEDQDVILVAGGIGLAPLRPVICQLLAQLTRQNSSRRVALLVGAREPSVLLYSGEYEAWRAGGLEVHVTVDRAEPEKEKSAWKGNIGIVTALLERLRVPRPENTVLMTCGPEVMMWYTIQTALGRGIRAEAMYMSLERNMNCAIGLCGHCQFGPHFLCKDGPVLRYDRVASLLKVDDL